MAKRIFLYVGPHRSGSTFLQTYIFPNIPGVCTMYTRDRECNYMVVDAMDEHPMFVDFEAIRERIYRRFENVPEDTIVISDEELFGDYTRGVASGLYVAKPFWDNQTRTAYLSKIFPNAKVILTPRRQDLWVESAYMHFVHNFFTLTMDEFLTPSTRGGGKYSMRSNKPCCDFTVLDWTIYVKNYHRVFGRDNVLVVPQDMVRHDLRQALDRIYAFMEVAPYYPRGVPQPGRSISTFAYKLALIFNRFVKTPSNPWGFLPEKPFAVAINKKRAIKDTVLLWFLAGITRRISLHWFLSDVVSRFRYEKPDILGAERRRAILEHFKESNKDYAELIGIDLGKYGYY